MEYQYLLAGEWYWAYNPTLISTVLGSCVAVVFYLPKQNQGGMFHSRLPINPKGSKDEECPFCYVDSSFYQVIQFFIKKNISINDIQISIYGGSKMFRSEDYTDMSIGRKNIIQTLKIIQQMGLKSLNHDVFGRCGRRIHLHTDTGEITVAHTNHHCGEKSIVKIKEMLLYEDSIKTKSDARQELLDRLSII